MASAPALSIIVRTVERPRRLAEALESLGAQTRRDIETVVVDMSRHGRESVVDEARRRLKTLLHLRVGQPLPRSVALNLGISRSTGEGIGILDDDNRYDPDHVARLVAGLEQGSADLVYTDVRCETYTTDGRRIDSRTLEQDFDYPLLIARNFIYASSCAFRKAAWAEVGGYDLRFPVFEDWDFLIRLCAPGKVTRLPGPTAVCRNFTGQVGKPSHHREQDDLLRCWAGLFWKHRKLYTPEVRNRFPGLPRWGVRRRGVADLLGWWWTCHLGHRRKERRWRKRCNRLPIRTTRA